MENKEGCHKRKYKDKIAAMLALMSCNKSGLKGRSRFENRIYFCEECNAYHLTSNGKSKLYKKR